MKRSLFAAAASMMMFAGVAQAQRPVTVGIAAGVSLPTSTLNDITKPGFNVAGSISFKPEMLPFAIRIEGAFDRFDLDEDVTGSDGNIRSLSLTANGVLELPSATPVKVYFIGGGGLYNLDASIDNGPFSSSFDSENKFGFNVGGGVRLPLSGFDTFIEARYHSVTDADGFRFIPITFGVRF